MFTSNDWWFNFSWPIVNSSQLSFRNRLYPGATTTSPDPRTTDDKFLVEVIYDNNKKEVISLLKKSNVSEINEKDEV